MSKTLKPWSGAEKVLYADFQTRLDAGPRHTLENKGAKDATKVSAKV